MRKMITSIATILAVSALMVGAASAADKLVVKGTNGTDTVFAVSDTGVLTLGASAFTPDANAKIHVKQAKSGVVALRVENPNIFNANDAAAQEQFVLGPAGQEHIIFQVLSDSVPGYGVPGVSGTALMNCYTHDFYIRTNAQNVFKLFKSGAVADTLVLKNGNVGVGTASPTHKLEVASGTIAISPATTTTAPTAGAADALPATPAGYMTITVNGVDRKIPYY
ncbi:MAG: hypothetical protein GJT30_10605 [Geobacter sp.]|nr:hypothetical protein [Geobacter sp.]